MLSPSLCPLTYDRRCVSLQDETADGDESVDPNAFDDEDASGAERGRDPHAMTQDEEDDFARELAKMMVSSSEARERKPVALDVGIPLIRRQKAEDRAVDESDGAGAAAQEENRGMQFTLLTKRGNKQQVRPLALVRRVGEGQD